MKSKSVGKWISRIYRSGQKYFNHELQGLGIGSGQIPILNHLFQEDGIIQDRLAEKIGIDRTTLNRTIRKLEENKLIRKEKNPYDKRAYQVFLTEKGYALKTQINPILSGWTAILTNGMDCKEKGYFLELLKRASQNAKSATDRI
jgi:DNA-binding MarR family transcriptional regulator